MNIRGRNWIGAILCLVVVCGAPSSAYRLAANRGLSWNSLAAGASVEAQAASELLERRIAQEGTTNSKLPPGSFDFPPEGAPPTEHEPQAPPSPRGLQPSPANSSAAPDSSSPNPAPQPSPGEPGTLPAAGAPPPGSSPWVMPAPSYPPPPYGGESPEPCIGGSYGYGGYAVAYGSYGYGGYGCHTPPSPPPYGGYYGSTPPPPYGGYGGYGGYGSYPPSPEVQPSPEPSPSSSPSPEGNPSPSPDENAPSPPPERWTTIWRYLEDVVVPDLWPFLQAAMDARQKAYLQDDQARFTLFVPLYEDMLKDELILSIFANPADPRNAMRLNRLMAYHQVLDVTIYPQDLQDNMTLTNMLGEQLHITQKLTEDTNEFYVDGVNIARWQVGGRGIVYWLNGVIHEPVAPSPPVAGPNRFGTLGEALTSLPQCSIMSALFAGVSADPAYGPLVNALLANPFTLLVPTDTAIATFLAGMGLGPSDLLTMAPEAVAAIVAPHLVVTGDAFLPAARLTPGAAVVTGLPPVLPSATLVVQAAAEPGALPVLAYEDGGAPPLHVLVADVFVRAEGDPTEAVVHVVDAVVTAPAGGAGRRRRNRRALSSH